MYKLLIVDDEVRVRRGLTKNIDWNSLGFIVVGSESNGQKAVESIKHEKPDVILTDVKMPVMSGIELMKTVKAEYPLIRVIVLSGYDEFEYAKEALSYGALEYLLKPTQIEEIERVFSRLKEELDREMEKAESYKKIKEQLKESLPLLKEMFLCDLIKGSVSELHEINNKLNFLELDIGKNNFCVLSVDIECFDTMDKKSEEHEKQIIKISVKNIIDDVLTGYDIKSTVFAVSDAKIVVILNKDNEDVSALENLKYKIAKTIRAAMNSKLDLDVTIGMGRAYQNLKNIYVSFNESNFAIKYKLYEGKNSIIDISDVSPVQDISYSFSRDKERDLMENFRLGDKSKVTGILNDIFEEILQYKGLSIDYVQRVCLELLISSSRYISEIGGNFKDIFPDNIISYMEISKYKTINEIRQWIIDIFSRIIDYILERRSFSKRQIIADIKKYICENYEQDINLKSVAEHFYINSEYLSRLFKRETDENFIDYLVKVRMEKAKELMVNNKELKIYEIANKVGYKDSKYFSRVFQKYMNMSPASYRKDLLI